MRRNQENSTQGNFCSELEFEKLLRRSEENFKSQHPGARKAEPKSNSLKIVPSMRRRDSAA